MSKRKPLAKIIEALVPERIAALPERVRALLTEADAMLVQGDSYEATRSLVSSAVRDLLAQPNEDYCDMWLRDIFNGNEAIYEYDGKTFQISFTIATAGGSSTVTLGEPKEVQVAYMPVGESRPAEFALDYVALQEKAVRDDGTFPIKLIQPGWGSSGYYSAAVLERDGAKAFPAGLKMFFDHPTDAEEAERPERSVRDLAATLTTAARWEANGAAGPGLYAEAKALDAYRPLIEELVPHIGLSIRAGGALGWGEAEGKSGAMVEAIHIGKSVDFVTEPGAGGKVLDLFESAHRRVRESREENDMDEKDKAELVSLREAAAKTVETEKKLQEAETELARHREVALVREASVLAAAQLRETTLPELTQERLVASVSARPPVKEGALDKDAFKALIERAAKDEAEYLAKLGGGRITGMGSSGGAHVDEAALDRSIEANFRELGLSEAGAKLATAGR